MGVHQGHMVEWKRAVTQCLGNLNILVLTKTQKKEELLVEGAIRTAIFAPPSQPI